jgi:hypothetical protein
MASDHHPDIARGPVPSARVRRIVSPLDFLFNRPFLIGVAAVLASLFYCRALAQTPALSEVNPSHSITKVIQPHQEASANSDDVPVLFLAVLGLAGLALSQTRPSSEPAHREVVFRAGKNGVRGQELPTTRRGQEPLQLPSFGQIEDQHPHAITGLESAH